MTMDKYTSNCGQHPERRLKNGKTHKNWKKKEENIGKKKKKSTDTKRTAPQKGDRDLTLV